MGPFDYSEGVTLDVTCPTKFWLLVRGWFWLPLLLVIFFGALCGVHSYRLRETVQWEAESRVLALSWVDRAYGGGDILSERAARFGVFRYSAKTREDEVVVFECDPRVPYCEPAGIDLRVSP